MEKAQKGDLVRITGYCDGALNIGDIAEVTDEYATLLGVFVNDAHYVRHANYVIHRKAGEEDSESPLADVVSRRGDELASIARENTPTDAVNSPNHYTQGKFETIEIIEEITKGYSDGYVAYCVGNALKYLARAPFKHGEPSEDLSKAAKYLAFASEYLDAKSTQD